MKNTVTGLSCILALISVAQAAPLSVTVENLEAREGKLYISVVDEKQFASMGQSMTDGVIEENVTDGAMSFEFDIPPGTYAVNVWHDDNGNDAFDFGARGPEDGLGVSGGLPEYRPATFDEAKFELTEEGHSVTVEVRYGR